MLKAPAARMTYPVQHAAQVTNLGTAVRRCSIQTSALAVFNSDRAMPLVEQNSRHEGIEFDLKGVRPRCALKPFPNAAAPAGRRRQRRERQPLGPLEALVIRVVLAKAKALIAREQPFEDAVNLSEARLEAEVEVGSDRADDSFHKRAIAERLDRLRNLHVEPAGKSVSARIDASASEKGDQTRDRPVAAVLDALEIPPHRCGTPRRVACELGDRVPVRVRRRHQDQGVHGRAAAEGRGPGIEAAASA